jgi:hypothetical protein
MAPGQRRSRSRWSDAAPLTGGSRSWLYWKVPPASFRTLTEHDARSGPTAPPPGQMRLVHAPRWKLYNNYAGSINGATGLIIAAGTNAQGCRSSGTKVLTVDATVYSDRVPRADEWSAELTSSSTTSIAPIRRGNMVAPRLRVDLVGLGGRSWRTDGILDSGSRRS